MGKPNCFYTRFDEGWQVVGRCHRFKLRVGSKLEET